MKKDSGILKLAAGGAFISLGVMVILSVIMQLIGYDPLELQEKYFAGYQPLPLHELFKLITVFKTSLIFDWALITGQILAWLGLSVLMFRRRGWIALAVAAVGIAGPVLDFVQNSMEWALVRAVELNLPVQPDWFFSWTSVTQGSFLFTFAGAFICGLMLYEKPLVYRLFSLTGAVLVIAGVLGQYVPGLGMLMFVWYLLWFLMSALLLIKESKALSSDTGNA